MRKKLLSTVVLIILLFSVSAIYANADDYEAVARSAGEFLYELELIKGDGSGDLKLNDLLSREESVILTLRMLRLEEQAKNYAGANGFSDVPSDSWWAPYINFAKANKIVNGIGGGKFGLRQNVTIKQLITMFLRAAKYSADWQTEDIWQKGKIFGLTTELDNSITENKQASRGDAFVIFAKAIKLPTNPSVQKNSCVLSQVLSEKPALMTKYVKYDFLEEYFPKEYTSNYDYLQDYIAKYGDVFDGASSVNTVPKTNPPTETEAPPIPVKGDLELVKSEPSDTINVMNLFFNKRLDHSNIQDEVEVVDVSGNFGDYSKAWFLDKNHYTVGTTDKKVYIRYNDGAKPVDLAGLTFVVGYNVKDRESNDRVNGTTTIEFPTNDQVDLPTLEFVEIKEGARNSVELHFSAPLNSDTSRSSATVLEALAVGGNTQDVSWLSDLDHYSVDIAENIVYISFIGDATHTVDLNGVRLVIEYSVESQDGTATATGMDSITFEYTAPTLEFVEIKEGALDSVELHFSAPLNTHVSSANVTILEALAVGGNTQDVSWLSDLDHYSIDIAENIVYISFFGDATHAVDLNGVKLVISYSVESQDGTATASGTESITFEYTAPTLELIKARRDGPNLVELRFSAPLNRDVSTASIAILAVEKATPIGQADLSWMMLPDYYEFDIADNSVYISFLGDATHAVDLDGVHLEIEYRIKAQDFDAEASGIAILDL